MRRGAFQVTIAIGVLLPLVALGVALAQPGVRRAIRAFVAPLPTAPASAAPSNVPSALPPVVALTGAESTELRALAADGGAPPARAPRTAIFPATFPAGAPPAEHIERPAGVRRPDIAARDDAAIDRAADWLAHDAHGHRAMIAAYTRSGRHRADVERVLRAWKVPDELSAIAFVESGFSPTATTGDGGAGLWSLPVDVAHAYSLTLTDKYDERRAVALSTETAGHYLSDLHDRLGSWELSILAFGAGYARTVDWLATHGTFDFWELAPQLPPESTEYVYEVLAVAMVVANPDRYGLDGVRPDDALSTSDLEVPAGTPFSIVARAAGTSVEQVKELNPEYLGSTVPDTGFAMTMHLPSAGLARAKELLVPLLYDPKGGLLAPQMDAARRGDASAPRARDGGDGGAIATVDEGSGGGARDEGSSVVVARGGERRMFYRASEGDTLDSLAKRFGVARETIASDNALDPSAGLRAGQLLTIRLPHDPASPAPTPHAPPASNASKPRTR